MRTLKKTLALVLVIAMMVSIGAIGAGAAFTDVAADNSSKEAVDVMSGIGVINGMTSTTFDPAGTLTREQAAKIIAYMLLGPTNAQLISSATTAKFADVAATRWSAGYIEYCANLGIIAGVGDNKFDPEGKLTSAAFTKMLLVALGYKADVEGLTGSSWAINTAALAVTAGVYNANIAISASANITRGQACQLALAALKAKTVAYTGGSTMTINGVTITTGATRAYVANAAVTETITNDDFMQFAEKYFPRLTTSVTVESGRNGFYWMNGTTVISSFITSDTVLATSTSGLPFATLTDATSNYYIKVKADTTVTYFYNDKQASPTWPTAAAGADDAAKTAVNVGVITGKAATAGVIVNFVDSDRNGKYDVVSVVEKTVEILAAAPTTVTTGSVTKVTIGSIADKLVANVSYPAGLVKGDVILWYVVDGYYYVEKATVLSGTVSAYTATTVTIDGVKHAISGLATKPGAFDTIAELQALIGKAGYTFYLDNGGNICYVVAPSGVATVSNTFFVAATDVSTSFGVNTYKAAIVKMDGTQEVITVKKTAAYGGTLTAITGVDTVLTDGKLVAGTFYTYALNADGTYNLTGANNQTKNATDLTKGVNAAALDALDTSFTVTAKAAKFLSQVVAVGATWTGATATAQTVLGTSSTVFMYYDATTKTYTALTGINNAQSYKAGGTIFVLNDATNAYAQVVICMGASTSAAAGSYDQIFVTGTASTSIDALGTLVYTYSAVINGVTGKTISSYATMNAGSLYFCNQYSTAGVALAVSTGIAGTAHTALADITYAGGTFGVTAGANAAYLLNSSAVIFLYDLSAGTIIQVTPEVAAAYTYAAGTDFLTVIPTSATDSSISLVYITVA